MCGTVRVVLQLVTAQWSEVWRDIGKGKALCYVMKVLSSCLSTVIWAAMLWLGTLGDGRGALV